MNLSAQTPVRRYGSSSGQATVEMVIMVPILLSLIFGGLVIIYSCWQGIKVQQAANFVARVQGQERVSGGTDPTAVTQANGVEMGVGGNTQDIEAAMKMRPLGAKSLWGRINDLVHGEFSEAKAEDIMVLPPALGLNVDKITVVRRLMLPKIPFFELSDSQRELRLQGKAWGGEDTYMYGLPRWGLVKNNGDKAWWMDQVKPSTKEESD